ncbi:hypothetical protein MHYP_G00102410 [Metynnis hypsauchen]
MSCLWTWCCRVREDDPDTDSKDTEEQQSEKKKKGKKKRSRSKRSIRWKKEKAETVQITVADEAAAEATNDTMNVCLEGSEEKHLDLQVSSNKDVADAIGELLETLFDDALLASLQPLENKIMDTNQVETEEDTQEKHLDHPVSSNKDVADAIGELLETLFDDALLASLQPLADNKIMDTNLAETEEDTQEKHLDHLVSSNKDVADAIGELLEIMFDDALSASLQPLDNKIMDTNLAETEEDTQEKHLDHLVSSNKDVADAIGELLETLFDDALLASLQPLENKIMDTNLAETEEDTQEKHLDHLVSSNKDVADAIGELLEIMFDDASLHPLATDSSLQTELISLYNHFNINQTQLTREASDPSAEEMVFTVSTDEALEATAPPPRENLTEEKDAAIKHLMKTLLDEVGIRTEQLLKAETVQITVADEAAAEATNDTMNVCLEGSEEKHLDLQVSSNKDVADAIGELLETLFDDALLASLQPLDHPVSSNKDVADAIGELLETLFDDALLASLQPLADNKIMDTNLAETEEDTQEKHLDHLVSSNKDVADAIGELLEIMFDDALSASLQPLDNKIMDTNLAETEEDTQEKHLDHLVSSNKDVADAIGELLETLFDDALLASLQPLGK